MCITAGSTGIKMSRVFCYNVVGNFIYNRPYITLYITLQDLVIAMETTVLCHTQTI